VEIEALLREMVERGASDLHAVAGKVPYLRVAGRLVAVDAPPVRPDAIVEVIPDGLRRRFDRGEDVDWSLALDGGFFRLHAYRSSGGPALAARRVPGRIPTIEELGLPPILHRWAQLSMGLVLVCGVTGSGKSTALASMLDEINRTRAVHILTVEDPIEYRYTPALSLVSQRQVGLHVPSFAAALRSAMREDPDVILVGEIRDAETAEAAMLLAESGHLLFSTLHVGSVSDIPYRMADLFPPERRGSALAQLAQVFQGGMVLRLLPRVGGEGETDPFRQRVAAAEVLVGTPAVKALIRSGEVHKLKAQMELEREAGMRSLDEALAELVSLGLVAEEEALLACHSPDELKKHIRKGAWLPSTALQQMT